MVSHPGRSLLFSLVSARVVECLWSGVFGLSQNICSDDGYSVLHNKKMLVDGETGSKTVIYCYSVYYLLQRLL